MSTTYENNYKRCATCNFWCGSRTPDRYGNRVSVDNASSTGRCGAQSGGYSRRDTRADMLACSGYQKWAVLK